MTYKDVANEMRANGVSEEDIATLIDQAKKTKFNPKAMDDALVTLGYDKIFTIDYDDIYEEDDFDEVDDFPSSEKIFRRTNKES
ncbi:hypothetical protein [Sulfurospirillum sp. 1612]|uniref:hypothetical protein n=1 Tax=Sulfurospirillum sp. 1612 TaxID=3094835 RepID=UPI002F957838